VNSFQRFTKRNFILREVGSVFDLEVKPLFLKLHGEVEIE
jgi:hypothetical protein